jgi:Coenzyme PQQ synthesis protein D (PqqD)
MLSLLKNRLPGGVVSRKSNPSHLGFRISPDVKASLHADGVVLINLRRGTVFSANRVGAMIWRATAERLSFDCVTESISRDFHVPAETAREDAANFLTQLASEGLLIADVH